jgi:hypothetical protein
LRKLVPKGIQQSTKNRDKNDPRSDFLRFLGVLGGAEIQTVLGKETSGPKIKKTAGEDDQENPCEMGSAAEAVPGEALESEDF